MADKPDSTHFGYQSVNSDEKAGLVRGEVGGGIGVVDPAVAQLAIAIDELHERAVGIEFGQTCQPGIARPRRGKGLAKVQRHHRGPGRFGRPDRAVGRRGLCGAVGTRGRRPQR